MTEDHSTFPKSIQAVPEPVKERFMRHILVSDEGCWLWKAGKGSKGYGVFSISNGNQVFAHRFSYLIFRGDPGGLCVLHACDNPPCVRPDHLFLGTRGDNNRDASAKGRSASGKRNGTHTHPESVVRGDRHHFHMNPETQRGARNGRAKFSDAQVVEIRARFAAGETQSALGREFGVSQHCIYDIVRGKTWRHVTS